MKTSYTQLRPVRLIKKLTDSNYTLIANAMDRAGIWVWAGENVKQRLGTLSRPQLNAVLRVLQT